MADLTDTSPDAQSKCAKVSCSPPHELLAKSVLVYKFTQYLHFIQIVDDLFELMSRCMFLAPLTHFRDQLDTGPSDEAPPPSEPARPDKVIKFPVDPINKYKCQVTTESSGSDTERVVVQGLGSDGYIMGLTALTSNHSWKVSTRAPVVLCGYNVGFKAHDLNHKASLINTLICTHTHTHTHTHTTQITVDSDMAGFCVGVGQKPLTDRATSTSDQFWLYEAHIGRLVHGGETGDLLPTLSRGDSITLNFSNEERTLTLIKNNDPAVVAFTDVFKEHTDLFPVILFNRSYNTSKVSLMVCNKARNKSYWLI